LKSSQLAALGFAGLLAACAGKPDHFYTLSVLPDAPRGALVTPVVHVLLQVSVPVLVDRAEMVVTTSGNGVAILDHERWTPLLSDQVAETLSRDLEQRRADLMVGDRGFDQGGAVPVTVKVDIVRMSVQRNGQALIEAHWRIVNPNAGLDAIGSDTSQATVHGDSYAAIAQSYSQALSELADRLVVDLGPR
jgi:uncharacterized lipoprotein YmbA